MRGSLARRTPVDVLDEDEELTQYVSRSGDEVRIVNQPRPTDQGELSLIRGKCDVAYARSKVRMGGTVSASDGIRKTTVGGLRAAGFTVGHTPTHKNADHVSVSYPGTWHPPLPATFDSCFTEVSWYGEEGAGHYE